MRSCPWFTCIDFTWFLNFGQQRNAVDVSRILANIIWLMRTVNSYVGCVLLLLCQANLRAFIG